MGLRIGNSRIGRTYRCEGRLVTDDGTNGVCWWRVAVAVEVLPFSSLLIDPDSMANSWNSRNWGCRSSNWLKAFFCFLFYFNPAFFFVLIASFTLFLWGGISKTALCACCTVQSKTKIVEKVNVWWQSPRSPPSELGQRRRQSTPWTCFDTATGIAGPE